MILVQQIFNDIYQAMTSPDTQLKEPDLTIAHKLFSFQKGVYGFDIGKANDIDSWLKIAMPDQHYILTPASRTMFNSLFQLYHANTHLLQLYSLIRDTPEFAKHYKIIKISHSPEIYDLCKLRPDELHENIAQKDIADACATNNLHALTFVLKNGIKLPIEIVIGDHWPAAVELLNIQRQPDWNLHTAIDIVNSTAKENLKYLESEQANLIAYRNMIAICQYLFSHKLITDEKNNMKYFNYTLKPGDNKNIDSWLSTPQAIQHQC